VITRDLGPAFGQFAQSGQRSGRGTGIGRVGHDRRQGAVEVHRDQCMVQIGPHLVDQALGVHTCILPGSPGYAPGGRSGYDTVMEESGTSMVRRATAIVTGSAGLGAPATGG